MRFHREGSVLLLLLGIVPALIGGAFASDIPKDILQQRDPFKMPLIPRDMTPKSELEMYPVDQFKLVGVLAGETELRAMVASPNGKTYFVRKGTGIGMRNGAIRKITESAVIVRETVTNVLGNVENVDTVIKLPSEEKQDVRTTTLEQGW